MFFSSKYKFHNPMIDAIMEPAFVFNENGRYVYCNAAAKDVLKMLDYSTGIVSDHRDAFIQILKFYGTPADSKSQEIALGAKRYHMITSLYEDGTLFRLVPTRENEHILRLSATLEVVPWGIITLDMSTEKPTILHCNLRGGTLLQMDRERMIGLNACDVMNMFGVTDDLDSYFHATQICTYDCENRAEGKACWYRLHFIPYTMDQPYCLIVIEDTTESKIMEGQYFQAQRLEALGQLAGGVAHDFNNILSIIDGYARIAKKNMAEASDARKYMDHIAQAVQRGSALTSQLLTFGRHKISRDTVIDLGDLVRDQETLLRPLMDATINLCIKADENVCVEVSPDNICQILLNLCINARDAMPVGGDLTVEVSTNEHGEATLRVIDTGAGMTPEVRAKMFDPFFTTKDQGKGTGLGLSMVYGLVKDMKGDIDVVSKIGAGTSITIYLPISEKHPHHREIIEDGEGNLHIQGFTALVAEDEPDLLGILSDTLENMGINVLRASNGNEALLVQDDYDGDIDLLITDVVMPEMNGVRLAELFESVRPESRVMFMSGYPANNLMTRVTLPDNAVMMPKPVEIKKLTALLGMMAKNRGEDIREKWKKMTGQWRTANG